jgi:hypothetical protein
MIKIQIPQNFEDTFLKQIEPLVVSRLENLRIALNNILGVGIVGGAGLDKYMDITVALIKLNGNYKFKDVDFKPGNYVKTLEKYSKKNKGILKIDFAKFKLLIDDLLLGNNKKLRELLVCTPLEFKDKLDELALACPINDKKDHEVLTLGFEYKKRANIGKALRAFFRGEQLVYFCPYCNQGKAMYTKGHSGKLANVHQLDHFYDKATYPLLCYSVYNLIPCDHECNAYNKGSKPFTNETHLNPYVDGYCKDFSFEPIYSDPECIVKEIKVKISPLVTSNRYKLLLGTGAAIGNDPEMGNINVFQIEGKYSGKDTLEISTYALQKILDAANNRRTLKDILKPTGLFDSYENYKTWYQKQMETRFEAREFNYLGNSKLKRDIHDLVYSRKKTDTFNKQIKQFIKADNAKPT